MGFAFAVFCDGARDILTVLVIVFDPQAIRVAVFVGTHHAEHGVTAFCQLPLVAFSHIGDVLHSFLIENALCIGILVKGYSVEVTTSQGEFNFSWRIFITVWVI